MRQGESSLDLPLPSLPPSDQACSPHRRRHKHRSYSPLCRRHKHRSSSQPSTHATRSMHRDRRWKNPCEKGKSMMDPLFPSLPPADPAGSPRCHWNRRYPNRSSSTSPEPCVGEGRWRDPHGRGRAHRIYPPLIVVVVIIPPRRHRVHLWIHAEGRGGGVIHAGGREPAKSAPSLVAAGGSCGLFLPPLSQWSSSLPIVDTCHLGCKRAYHRLPK